MTPPFATMLQNMSYAGGKNGSGVYQKIINLMPPHAKYIEACLGGGAIMRLKRPAKFNIGIDLDADVANAPGMLAIFGDARYQFINADAIEYLKNYNFIGDELIYFDPPYPHETRTRAKLYKHEMTDQQHKDLLEFIKQLPCMVMISSYFTQLYADQLANWNCINFQAMTRSGKTATEYLWYNFETPLTLHDYSYLGDDFRERERIKRKKQRWVKRLQNMPTLERQALLGAIAEVKPAAPTNKNGDA